MVGPWSLFSRMHMLAGGHVLEGVDSYNKVHNMTNVIVRQKAESMLMINM